MEKDKVQAPSQLDFVSTLLGLIGGGGTTQTQNPGNISYLQQLLGEMQGPNYEGLLAQIFQQAQGAIPGLQAAYGNAVGARSGNNSAVAAALQELLKSTTIEAQNNIVNQTLQNQQIRGNAAANVATATQGTQSTTRPNSATGSTLGDLGAIIALLQGAKKLTGSDTVTGMFDKFMGGGQTVQTAQPSMAPVQSMSSAPAAPSFSLNPMQGAGGLSFGGVSSAPMIGSPAPAAPQVNYNNPAMAFTPDYSFGNTNMSNLGLRAPAPAPVYNIGSYDYGLSSGGGSPGLSFDISRWF